MPARGQHLLGVGQCPLRCTACCKSASNIWCCFSHGQDSHSGNEGLGKGEVPLTIPSSDLLGSLALCPCNFRLCWFRGLSFRGKNASTRDITVIPLNWELIQSCGHAGLLMSVNQQAKKGVTVLPGVINLDYQGKLGCSYTVWVRRSMLGIQTVPYGIS